MTKYEKMMSKMNEDFWKFETDVMMFDAGHCGIEKLNKDSVELIHIVQAFTRLANIIDGSMSEDA